MTWVDKICLFFTAVAVVFCLLTAWEMFWFWWEKRVYERTGRKRWLK